MSEQPQYPFALPIGTQISGYEIVRVLGVGGFGITYEGFNPVTRRRAAIKEFFPRGIASRENATQVVFSRHDNDVVTWALDRFRRSTTELCEFKHPNIVDVLNYVPANETGYMFMEQVEGETLEQWLRDRGDALKFDEMRTVLDPICDALEYVHSRKFIHRDIAPDNIMIRKDGRPMLIDFGAIKIIAQTAQTRAASGRSYGVAKQHYSPPEQLDNEAELDPRADVYALGAVLYRAVTGRPPADADKRKNDLILKGADSYVSVAQSARISLPHSAIDAIDRALSLKPADRPSSIAEFREGLREESAQTAVIKSVETVKVEPMPTPGFSGPGAKASMPHEAAVAPTNLLDNEQATRAQAPRSAAAPSAPAPSAEAAVVRTRSRSSWIGIAAIATTVVVVAGVLSAASSGWITNFSDNNDTNTNTNTNTNNNTNNNNLPPSATAKAALDRADKFAKDGNHAQAIAGYGETIRLAGSDNATRLAALKGRARSHGVLRHYSEQIADLSEVLRFEPTAVNYSLRGTAYWFANEYDRAISDQTQAIKLEPTRAAYYGERGRTNMWKKDYISAIADFSDAIRLDPTAAYYYARRGQAHANRNDFVRALNDYAVAIKQAPADFDYYRERADIYVQRADASAASRIDDLNRARADLDVVIRDAKTIFAADYEKRGLIFERLGNRSDALADFRAALAREPNRPLSQQGLRRLGG